MSPHEYRRAREVWRHNGRRIARLKDWRRGLRAWFARRGRHLGDDPELEGLAAEWGEQGRALFMREQPGGDGLGFLFLIPWVIGGAVAIYGAYVAKRAIDVKEVEAQQAEAILRRVDAGELSPGQAESLLSTAGASASRPILQQILGVPPLVLATLAGAWVFRRPLGRMLRGTR